MTWTFEATRLGYLALWRTATVKPGLDGQNAETFANKIIAGEQQYRQVQAATGVPWFFVGALHMREGSCDFERALCNGEKIIGTGRVTTLVPAGRGPYPSWFDSGIDAMKLKDLHRVQEWPVERMLYSAEVYNGLGYAGKVNSPYVWAGTINEQTGKYTSDHHFDPSVDDPQLGVAAVLKRLAEKRPDIAAALRTEGAPGQVEVLPPLAKFDPNALAPLLNMLLPFLLQLAARTQQPGGAPAGQQPDILALLLGLAGGQPVVLPPPVVAPPKPAPAPAPPVVVAAPKESNPLSMLFSVLLGAGTATAMSADKLGTPFGFGTDPTLSGSLMTIASMASPLIAMIPGGYGVFLSAGLNLLTGFANKFATKAPPK